MKRIGRIAPREESVSRNAQEMMRGGTTCRDAADPRLPTRDERLTTNTAGADGAAGPPVHAWRALGQLRATEAIEPLIPLFDLIESDDYVPEIAEVLAMIWPAAFPPLLRHLADTSRPLYSRTLAIEAIAKLGVRYPSIREDAVATLTGYLRRFDSQGPRAQRVSGAWAD